uniref:Uncharacterized protein n=1 Tax=Panagrolaimus sp. PS1159 TaxID=55785 RepID=A0AC35GBN5_9BILA
MGAVDLQNAYETDSKAVKSLLRSTIRSAMDPTNTSYNITTIKLDFSNGRLLVGDDPRYIYRSPVMTVETIPIDSTYDSERDVSIASEIIEGGTRKYAGGGSIAAAIECGRSSEINSSMLNTMADGESTVTAYDYFRAYLKANDLSEGEYPFIPNENDASHISKEDIVKWIEDGERAVTNSVPQKADRQVTSMNSFSTLKSISSTSTTTTFEKSNYGIREIVDENVGDNDTLEDVTSLASTIESSENYFSETPIIRTPY